MTVFPLRTVRRLWDTSHSFDIHQYGILITI